MNLLATLPYPKTFAAFNGLVAEWLLIWTCFGYPIQAMVVLYSGFDSTPVNASFRAIYLFVSICLVAGAMVLFRPLKRSSYRLNIPLLAFVIFWILYGTRLVYDLEWKGLQMLGYHKYYVYAWAFGCSMIPALALLLNGRYMVAERLTKNMFYFLFTSIVCLTVYLVVYSGVTINELLVSHYEIFLSGKVTSVQELPVELKRASDVLINSITISFYGSLMVVTSVAWFLFYQRRVSVWYTLLLVAALVMGIFLLMVGASRGPLLMFLFLSAGLILASVGTFLVRFSIYALALFPAVSKKLKKLPRAGFSFKPVLHKLMMLLTGLMLIFTVYNYGRKKISFEIENLALKKRVEKMLEYRNDKTANDRIEMWTGALHQFKTNPVFGDSFINNVGNLYSHNIFMDVLMSVGVVGSLFFIIYLLAPFYYLLRLPSERKRSLSVLFTAFLAFLALYMTSGGLFTAAEFWILSAALIGISRQYLRPGTAQ